MIVPSPYTLVTQLISLMNEFELELELYFIPEYECETMMSTSVPDQVVIYFRLSHHLMEELRTVFGCDLVTIVWPKRRGKFLVGYLSRTLF